LKLVAKNLLEPSQEIYISKLSVMDKFAAFGKNITYAL
jgi:hypothetical protein